MRERLCRPQARLPQVRVSLGVDSRERRQHQGQGQAPADAEVSHPEEEPVHRNNARGKRGEL